MMTTELLIAFLASTAGAATPLVVASMGELVTERSGVLNLGMEGMMLVGAVVGFGVTLGTGSMVLGLLAAMAAGMLMALVFGFLVLTLQTNQVATGLALTLFGIGVSAFLGRSFVGQTVERMPNLDIPLLSDLPFIGPLLFRFDAMTYASVALVVVIGAMLARTRLGLVIRAVGESPHSAHAIGFNVIALRYGTVLFGGVTVLHFHGQGMGLAIPSEFLSMLPYVATIVVLVLICRNPQTILLNKPMSLGQNFKAD